MTRAQIKTTTIARWDYSRPQQAAAGPWTDILADVAGLPRESLDGRHREGWCEGLAKTGKPVRNVVLPGPIVEDHGHDLRDYFLAGGGIERFLSNPR